MCLKYKRGPQARVQVVRTRSADEQLVYFKSSHKHIFTITFLCAAELTNRMFLSIITKTLNRGKQTRRVASVLALSTSEDSLREDSKICNQPT